MRLNGKLYVTAARICCALCNRIMQWDFFSHSHSTLLVQKQWGVCAWWNTHAAVNKFAKSPRGVLAESCSARCTPKRRLTPVPTPSQRGSRYIICYYVRSRDADITSSPAQRFCVSCNNPLVNHI